MIQITPAVIVEGKYDKIKLSSMLDTLIIATDGFSIFKDVEKQKLIRRIAEKRGILILTDSDAAGFKIRAFIGGSVPPDRVMHAYIPDILGKEKRKSAPSKEGKLGVEGMPTQILLQALEKAGVFCTDVPQPQRRITHADLYADGFSGKAGSRSRRAALLRYFDLPERLNKGALLQVLNTFIRYDEYRRAADALKEERS
jgi:ribonuclease M5